MKKKIILAVTLILGFIIVYNVYDNNRIIVKKEEIPIENLPKEFEGFTILQITDLHEKVFGKNQEKLVNKINSQIYDMIALTGDMQNINRKNKEPLLKMLDGIKNKNNMIYVPGNHGPKYDEELKYRGCIALDVPYKIEKGNSSMYIYDFYDRGFRKQPSEMKNSDINIALTHIPWDEKFYETSENIIGKYDLVLSGHYHGGQIRIPFYGALFVPNINGDNFFPEQNEVSGLNTWNGYNQYVSRGLGASSKSIITRFRLFNTPEINVLTLVKLKK